MREKNMFPGSMAEQTPLCTINRLERPSALPVSTAAEALLEKQVLTYQVLLSMAVMLLL